MNILENDSDSEITFTINKNYADKYDKWRQGEELQKLKDKYGDGDNSETESSSSEDEDEDARELTKNIEKDFFKTLSCLKEKNPIIYDPQFKFFNCDPTKNNNTQKNKKQNDHFYSVAEYQRNLLLKKGGRLSDDEDNGTSFKEMTNVEQERALKESFKDVLRDSDTENETSDWGGLFTKRIKTHEELQTEEEDYKLWLAGQKESLRNSEEEKELKGLKDFWSNPTLDENEQFLRDYILNKRFLEKTDKNRVPTYDEIVHDSDSGLSADENTLQQQEEFERKYNFRFEEPDKEFIKRYPRTLEQSMRKKDDRRKKHREEVKVRKEAEKAKKSEELKQLKVLKRKEIMEKIRKLQEITGNKEIGFKQNDLEKDFDPEEHDKRMSELFNEQYYGTCDDEEKPEYPELDEELEIENWDEYGNGRNEEEEEEELHCEDPGFNMDCDYDPNANKLQKELLKSSKKKKRRQSKFAAAVAKDKPIFDPTNKTFEKYVDEYYALDYEDLIGDLPCRFKYRKVIPNDFGLSVEEILAAPDKELNSWVSLKKIMQRRPEHVELYDVKAYKKKAKDFEKKKKCLPSIYGSGMEESNSEFQNSGDLELSTDINSKHTKKRKIEETPSKEIKQKKTKEDLLVFNEPDITKISNIKEKKKKNKKNKKASEILETNALVVSPNKKQQDAYESKKEKNKNKFNNAKDKKVKEKNNFQGFAFNIPDSRLKSYGINPKKLKNKLKYKNTTGASFTSESNKKKFNVINREKTF